MCVSEGTDTSIIVHSSEHNYFMEDKSGRYFGRVETIWYINIKYYLSTKAYLPPVCPVSVNLIYGTFLCVYVNN